LSPRSRTIPDADVLAAARRIIAQLGAARLTLAAVAREAGLAPATLIQRFGSKRGLLLALVEMGVDEVEAGCRAARSAHRSPLAALVDATTDVTRRVTSPEELANRLAFLQMELTDPDFRRLAVEHARRAEAGYRALLDDAVAAGELLPCDTVQLSRSVAALSGGSLIAWAVRRKGSARQWVKDDLMTLLAPYRAGLAKGRPHTKSRRKPQRRR
jgi:AcrR family transcriptional regulator